MEKAMHWTLLVCDVQELPHLTRQRCGLQIRRHHLCQEKWWNAARFQNQSQLGRLHTTSDQHIGWRPRPSTNYSWCFFVCIYIYIHMCLIGFLYESIYVIGCCIESNHFCLILNICWPKSKPKDPGYNNQYKKCSFYEKKQTFEKTKDPCQEHSRDEQRIWVEKHFFKKGSNPTFK